MRQPRGAAARRGGAALHRRPDLRGAAGRAADPFRLASGVRHRRARREDHPRILRGRLAAQPGRSVPAAGARGGDRRTRRLGQGVGAQPGARDRGAAAHPARAVHLRARHPSHRRIERATAGAALRQLRQLARARCWPRSKPGPRRAPNSTTSSASGRRSPRSWRTSSASTRNVELLDELAAELTIEDAARAQTADSEIAGKIAGVHRHAGDDDAPRGEGARRGAGREGHRQRLEEDRSRGGRRGCRVEGAQGRPNWACAPSPRRNGGSLPGWSGNSSVIVSEVTDVSLPNADKARRQGRGQRR